MAKVHVVGAGPAGCISAISAARQGHKVYVSEEHKQAGTPVNCSGLFSKEGLDSLRDIINYRKFIVNDMWGADIHFVDELLLVRSKKTMGYVCDRAAFDTELASTAEIEGARISFGERVKDEFKAPNVIGADGPNSHIARHFGMGNVGRVVSTLRGMAKYSTGDKHIAKVFLSSTHFPGFFGWIIPHDEENAEFGVGVELPNDVQEAWKHLLKLVKVTDAPRPTGAIIPIDIREKTAIKDKKTNVLLVGDAAGQVKATSGGGVVFGGLCAKIAGQHFTNPLRYNVEWRMRYGADLGLHKMARDFLNWKTDSELKAFGRRLRKMRFDEYLSKNGSMDRPSKMIKPQMLLHLMKNIAGDD
ncbi:MAG: NAD(P)/FAD-dependent oxidoreductase [Candidatus Micrarchaeota archaeon]